MVEGVDICIAGTSTCPDLLAIQFDYGGGTAIKCLSDKSFIKY